MTLSLNLFIRRSKTDQGAVGTTKSRYPIEDPQLISICPVKSSIVYKSLRRSLDKNPRAFLCDDEGRAIKTKAVVTALQQAGLQLGVGDKLTHHCIRAGAATHLWLQGATEEQVKRTGRWRSAAYRTYILPTESEEKSMSAMMGSIKMTLEDSKPAEARARSYGPVPRKRAGRRRLDKFGLL